jgi:hypothetical protein
MKKLIALSLAMLFLGVGIASATDFSVTGSYFVRGTYYNNLEDLTNGKAYGNYDHELSIDPTWKIDDTTMVITRFEIRDQYWGTADTVTEGAYTGAPDDNIVAEHVYGVHTFGNGLTVKAGLMPAGAWASDFGNTTGEAYRLFFSMPTGAGVVIGILEKAESTTSEQGNSVNGEDEDNDTYLLGLVTKIGDINVKPLVGWANNQSDTPTADLDLYLAFLSVDGTFGNIGFEAEFDYKDYNRNGGLVDFSVWGIYGNVWAQLDALKIGAFACYGSWDDDAHTGYDPGDDFYPGNMLIMGDDAFEGPGQAGALNMGAGTLVGLYGSYAVNDQLTLGAFLGYDKVNRDDVAQLGGMVQALLKSALVQLTILLPT